MSPDCSVTLVPGPHLTDYYLFYATKSLKGVQKMKEAMWTVDPSGEFKFSDATDPNQMVMFGDPPFEILRAQILERFSNREVTVQEVEEFVLAETAFRETHYKRQVLATLEQSYHRRLSGCVRDRSARLARRFR